MSHTCNSIVPETEAARAVEMVQWVKLLVISYEFNSWTHMVERTDSHIVSSDLHKATPMHTKYAIQLLKSESHLELHNSKLRLLKKGWMQGMVAQVFNPSTGEVEVGLISVSWRPVRVTQ